MEIYLNELSLPTLLTYCLSVCMSSISHQWPHGTQLLWRNQVSGRSLSTKDISLLSPLFISQREDRIKERCVYDYSSFYSPVAGSEGEKVSSEINKILNMKGADRKKWHHAAEIRFANSLQVHVLSKPRNQQKHVYHTCLTHTRKPETRDMTHFQKKF